jgi:hypothetical protein
MTKAILPLMTSNAKKIKEAACEHITASKSALFLRQAHATTTTSDAHGSLFEEDSKPEW